MVKKGWFVGDQQECAKRFIRGSATYITRRFDYALGLASQFKVNASYSEVVFPWIETLIYVSTLKILLSIG
eukprot:9335666-Ditylum_brightwellii.AAC.1